MMRAIGTAVSSALLLLSASEAGAVCSRAKMRGIWQFYTINNIRDENGIITNSYVGHCQIRVNEQGTITEDLGGAGIGSCAPFYLDASFTVNRSCAVQLEVEFPANTEEPILSCSYEGQFQGDQKLATGIGNCAGAAPSPEFTDPVFFSLVKGRRAAGTS